MAVEMPAGKPEVTEVVSDRRLWLDATKERVVEDGDVDAAFLLVGAGSGIPLAEFERLALSLVDGKIVHQATAAESAPQDEE